MAIISSKSDYHYTDLSGWSGNIGSDIYPLRDDDQKRVLKFCDKAFITEAYLSRAYAGLGITLNGGKVFMASSTPPSEGWAGTPLSKVLTPSGGFGNSPNTKWGTSKPTITKDQLFDSESALYAAYFGDWQYITTWYRLEASASYPLYEYFIKDAYSRISNFKSYKYSYAAVAKLSSPTYERDNYLPLSEQCGYSYFYSNAIYDYKDDRGRKESPYEHEGQMVQTSPIYTLDVQEPAKSGVQLELYLLCYINASAQKSSGQNDRTVLQKHFLYPLSSSDGRSVSNALLSYAKSLIQAETWSSTRITDLYTQTNIQSSLYIAITFKSIVAVLTSNVDIDY